MTKSTPSTTDRNGRTPARKRGLAVLLLKLSLTVLLLGALIEVAGWHALEEAVSRTDGWWLLALYATTLCSMGVHCQRLSAVLRLVGLRLRYWRVFLASALSAFYGLVLPGDLLAGVAKWANLSAATGRGALVFSAIVYNRLMVVVSTLLFGALAVAGQNHAAGFPVAGSAIVLAVAVSAVAVSALHPRSAPFLERWAGRVGQSLPAVVGRRVVTLVGTLARFRAFTATDHMYIFFLAFCSFVIALLIFVCASRAVGVALPFLTVVWVCALLLIVRLLPITISNLGVREGLLVVILGGYGIDPAQALAVGLIHFTSSLVSAAIGALYQAALLLGFAQWHRPGAAG